MSNTSSPHHTPFLSRVADVYLANERGNLIDYCFVFPNKRSGVFFRHYLAKALEGSPLVMPGIMTISEMTADFSDMVEATRFEQLFILYNEYRKLSDDVPTFDQFLFWGDMLLSDFNDVDRYLVDPHQLFVNVKRLREINSTYLTEDQLDVIRRYWGENRAEQDIDRFWSHIRPDAAEGDVQGKFLKLWEVLDPLFFNFKKQLEKHGLCTQGMYSRNAVERLRSMPSGELPFRRYIFVGFNVLSVSEIKIFELLKVRGIADFYWDFNSPAYALRGNKAVRFLENNVREFPSIYNTGEEPITEFPHITITGVPSRIGMVKAAGNVLAQWVKDNEITNPSNAIDTAVVLPEENLFIPMIHSVPTEITAINVTMGFPVRHTPIASFVSKIISMHIRARVIKGSDVLYYYEDVREVVTHPVLRAIAPEECDGILAAMTEKRLYNIPATLLTEKWPATNYIFAPVLNQNDMEEVYGYCHRLVTSLLDAVKEHRDDKIEVYFMQGYLAALEELKQACDTWGISMKELTFFILLERAVASASINFAGEPLKGLQVMGVLETRALDFDNIIMLSMNERIFPRKHYTRSFIPDALRRGFGMATEDFQESIYAYYFYRLIARARNVSLFYDARTVGGKSSEISRYLSQLLYLFPAAKALHRMATFDNPEVKETPIVVPKKPDTLKRLDAFRAGASEKRYLSASAINSYINCPLSFYLQYIEGINLDDEVMDYMDSSTYGTIVHQVAQWLYEREAKARNVKELFVDTQLIDKWLDNRQPLDSLIIESVNLNYNKLGEGNLTPLTGEAHILADIIKIFIRKMLEEDKKFTPFIFMKSEELIIDTMDIAPGLTVNIKQYIDRVDRVNISNPDGSVIRLIDYKTGGDNTVFTKIDQLFDNKITDRRKAVLQLMFYCNAYAKKHNYKGPIQPIIYLFKTISTKGITPIKYGKQDLLNYLDGDLNDEFMKRFNETIVDIFDPDKPFIQAPDEHSCQFCNFKAICGRE